MHKIKRIFVKIITLALISILVFSSTFTYAAVPKSSTDYEQTVEKLILWGVIDNNDLISKSKMTRELFAKIIVNSTGNNDLAQSLSDSSTFSDVSAKSSYCGYINASVKLGYLSAYSDGKFKPQESITFAQFCTSAIKALGYTNEDIVGTWPAGYINKAKSLGITSGYSFTNNSALNAEATIIMIQRTLNTNIKKVNTQDTDTTLVESSGIMEDKDNWVYGKPEVALSFNPDSKRMGNINFKDGIPILRDTYNNTASPATKKVGEIIGLSDIKDKDVVYEVYNKLNVLIYYLVVDNKVEGEITSILPSKYSPKTLQITSVNYELGQYAELNKFNSTPGSFNTGDSITAILGYDGKVVEAFLTVDENNEDYAFVLNCSTMVSKEAADYNKQYYTVDLLHVDGSQKTYKINMDPRAFKWRLVQYSLINDDTVALLNMTYDISSSFTVDINNKKIGGNYVTDNVKIFNYTDYSVKLVRWSDIPNGRLLSGKIKYLGYTGDFNDVNVICAYDIFNEQNKDMVVKSIEKPIGTNGSYKYELVAGTSQYTYTTKEEIPNAAVGTVFSMKMNNDVIVSYNHISNPVEQWWYVQAVDSKRIKINNVIYFFSSTVSVYFNDYSGKLAAQPVSNIRVGPNQGYESINIYTDRPLDNGGKVTMLVFNLK